MSVPETEPQITFTEGEHRVRLTVGDGFKLGCGLILAWLAFFLALFILITATILAAILLNVPIFTIVPGLRL
ncbi:MAG: hypothetical protein M1136_09630 [Chloroflexi bacterium]|nr:hypothetical protein [Chloroflexota bacterium]MCL5075888.1 hypothetical protein [Chloroflexota bacterium]